MAGKTASLVWAGFLAAAAAGWAEDGEEGGKADPPLRFALDALLRPEAASHLDFRNFSYAPGQEEARILTRLRPSVTTRPSEALSARVEGQWYAFHGERDASSSGLYQGYVEGALPGVSLKAGRQELSYGSAFLLGPDGFYDGLSFDAAKLSIRPSEGISVDLLGSRYAGAWAGGITGKLHGIHATWAPREAFSADLYGFRDTGDAGALHPKGDHERTDSFGARFSGRAATRLSYEVEPVIQRGRKNRDGTGHDHIRASGGHADLALDVPFGGRPGRLFLAYAFGSGDGNAGDRTFREFHNPNNDTSLIGDMNVIGDLSGLTLADPGGNDVAASGLRVLTAGGGVDLTERLNLSLDAHRFWAQKAPAGISREIGYETNLILTWKMGKDTTMLVSVNRFFTGEFFRDAAKRDKDIHYVYAQLQIAF